MKITRNRFQEGSLRKVQRKSGAEVWEYRYRNHAESGSPMRQLTLSVLEYPTATKARLRLQEEVLKLNGPDKYRAKTKVTMAVLIERFMTEERLEEIVKQPVGEITITDGLSYSTAMSYRSYLVRHIKPKWGNLTLGEVKPLVISEWIKALTLAPKTKAHIRGLLHLLFERAMLWELIELQRNPVELVRVKGSGGRVRQINVLTPEQFQTLLGKIDDPYRTMVLVAICTGMRVSEVLALRWEHINFADGVIHIQKGVVQGRIGKVKTEASNDFVPIDPIFAAVLQQLRGDRRAGLVFPSHVTGGCYHASEIQKDILKPAGESMGFGSLGWHALRHTYRTLLDETGAPIGVQQKLMRHANVSTTMNVYGKSSMRAKADANSKVVQMLIVKERLPDVSASRAV